LSHEVCVSVAQKSCGGSGANANAAVPEPATLMLLMFAAAAGCVRRCWAA
jgi:hypothetical protein